MLTYPGTGRRSQDHGIERYYCSVVVQIAVHSVAVQELVLPLGERPRVEPVVTRY